MAKLVLWKRVVGFLDQYGRAETVFSFLARAGAVLFGLGGAWAMMRGLWEGLPLFSQLTLATGGGFMLTAGVGKAVTRFRAWHDRKQFNLVISPLTRPNRLELLLTNRGQSDEFKANLYGNLYFHLDDYPRTLQWRDVPDEYRTIFGTASDVLHLFDYEIRKTDPRLPPEVLVTIPSPLSGPLFRTIEVGDYNRQSDEQFGGEKAEARLVFEIGVVGRETAVSLFNLDVQLSWFSLGPISYEVFAQLTPSPNRMMGWSVHREVRPLEVHNLRVGVGMDNVTLLPGKSSTTPSTPDMEKGSNDANEP